MLEKVYGFIYRWAMGVKKGEDATRTGVYYIQDWE